MARGARWRAPCCTATNDDGDDVRDFASAIEVEVIEPRPLLLVVSSYDFESGGYVVNVEKL